MSKGQKILIIEDNEDVRENTAELLELANYNVVMAENGRIGVTKAREYKPDLIICDVMMPELDGYGVLNLLLLDTETATIPFVFLTAKADKSDFRKGMNLGADDYLTKPFDESDLLDIVRIRIKKAEVLKKDFSAGVVGYDSFIDKVTGIDSLFELSKDRKQISYRRKEVVYRQGDYASSVYILISGKLKISSEDDNAKEYITELISPGEYFGYLDILLHSERTENVSILEDAVVCRIPKEDFEQLIYHNKEVAAKFIQLLAGNVKEKEERLLRLAFQSVRMRVRDALILLRDKYKSNKKELNMSISREDLASIVGTSSETVIRTLSDFKAEGLIEVNRSEIRLLNEKGLEELKF